MNIDKDFIQLFVHYSDITVCTEASREEQVTIEAPLKIHMNIHEDAQMNIHKDVR